MSGSSIQYGPATAADLPAVEELERHCFPHDPWGRVALESAFGGEGYLVWVARMGREIVGYVIGWEVAKEVDLARIGVLPPLRGQGIGARLMQETIAVWRRQGAERIFLDVRAGNTPALRLYASCGFQSVGKRRGYYHDGEDAVVMSMQLNPPGSP